MTGDADLSDRRDLGHPSSSDSFIGARHHYTGSGGGGGGVSDQECSGSSSSSGNNSAQWKFLLVLMMLKAAGSFDSGAFSAVLGADGGVTDDLGLNPTEQGVLGSSVFLGLMIGCLIAGHMFSNHRSMQVLTVSLIAHAISTFVFASVDTYRLSLIGRFFIGVTLGFIVVFAPLWVDEFAPVGKTSTWMALQNASVPIGVMLGYVMGGLLPTYHSGITWKWVFYLKALVLVPLVMLVTKSDPAFVNLRQRARPRSPSFGALGLPTPQQSASSHETAFSFCDVFRRILACIKQLLKNGIFVCNVLVMSSLYFVVTGLQTFAMPYLRAEPFNATPKDIVLGFGVSVVSAPVLGVIAGGLLLDRIGGYHGNMHRASLFGFAWVFAAAFMSILCIFSTTTAKFLAAVWCLLFCGAQSFRRALACCSHRCRSSPAF